MRKNKNIIKIAKTASISSMMLVMSILIIIVPVSCSDSNVAAKVGDKEITKIELEKALEEYPLRKRDKLRRKVLDDLIKIEVFSNEARKIGLDKNVDVKAEIEKIKNETLAHSFVVLYINDKAKPTEEEIKKYYEQNIDLFSIPEGVLIQHLLYKTKEKAIKASKRLKNGASFETLAKQSSICECWKNEGRHDWLYKGKMDSELEKTVSNIEDGALSNVIKTKDGYQLVKVLSRKEAKKFSLNDAEMKINDRLFQNKRNELIQSYLNQAKIDDQPSEKGVLVKIGEEKISEDSIANILNKLKGKEREELKKQWINYFVETKVFSTQARKVNLEDHSSVKKELILKINKKLADAFFKLHFANTNKTNQVDDKAIEEYYKSHQKEFVEPVQYRARTILVKTREEALEIKALLAKGKEFSVLVYDRSIHPSAKTQNGELGWFIKGKQEAAIENAVAKLKKNEISDILETKSGFHILKLMDKIGGNAAPLEKVKPRLKMTLTKELNEKFKNEYYEKAGVEVLL